MFAYVLIVAEPLKEHTVYCALCKSDVDEVHPLFGEWDIIVRVSAEDKEELEKKILENITPTASTMSTTFPGAVASSITSP